MVARQLVQLVGPMVRRSTTRGATKAAQAVPVRSLATPANNRPPTSSGSSTEAEGGDIDMPTESKKFGDEYARAQRSKMLAYTWGAIMLIAGGFYLLGQLKKGKKSADAGASTTPPSGAAR
mmetsp:Transcript_7872/g.23228  ORF Transcript_7872/g.23228 Transcript_7872/m.23228 type:complete len:121 (+) Transcript_7872:104-466(+)